MNYPSIPKPTPQTVAVTNTLTGERLAATIQFPMTGDLETDFISGVRAAVQALDIKPPAAMRVLRYLLERFEQERDNLKDSLDRILVQQMQAGGLIGQAQAQPPLYTTGTTQQLAGLANGFGGTASSPFTPA